MKRDLHIHTHHSDGEHSFEEIVEKVKNAKLKEFAITDHDTIAGNIALLKEKDILKDLDEQKIRFRTGIEISCHYGDYKIHILGLDVDIQNSELNNLIEEIVEGRKRRALKIFDELENKFGIKLKKKHVEELKQRRVLGKPHIAEVLVKEKFAENIQDAFDKYLKKIKIQEGKITVQKAVDVIHGAGGIAVWAHPKTSMYDDGFTYRDVYKTLKVFKSYGLDGVETKHSCHMFKDKIIFGLFAKGLKLIKTEGSDYHGETVLPGVELGDCHFQQTKFLKRKTKSH